MRKYETGGKQGQGICVSLRTAGEVAHCCTKPKSSGQVFAGSSCLAIALKRQSVKREC
jgi:hypothetical protein